MSGERERSRESRDYLLRTESLFDGDRFRPDLTHLLIRNGKIAASGGEELAQLADSNHIPCIDCSDSTVLPGFVDAHCHFLLMGLMSLSVNAATAASVTELYEAIAAENERVPGDSPIIANGWDESVWPDRVFPSRRQLDAISTERPIIAYRVCGHMAVVNTAALRLIPEQYFSGDAERGLVVEHALDHFQHLGRAGEDRFRRALTYAQNEAYTSGVTAVHDIVSSSLFSWYQRFLASGDLGVRVTAYLPAKLLSHLTRSGLRGNLGNDWLRFGGIKVFADGSMGARTAALRAPYADEQTQRGLLLFRTQRLREIYTKANDHGIPVMTHAIGDRAIEQVIGILEGIPDHDLQGSTHRIEHLEVLSDDLLRRMRSLKLTASVQPNFARRWSQHPDGMNWHRLGPERMRWCNAYQDLRDTGLPVVFGSDCMPFGPLYGLYGAVMNPISQARMNLEDSLHAATKAAAIAGGMGSVCGSIAPGFQADIVMVQPVIKAAQNLEHASVAATMIAGSFVYRKADWPSVVSGTID